MRARLMGLQVCLAGAVIVAVAPAAASASTRASLRRAGDSTRVSLRRVGEAARLPRGAAVGASVPAARRLRLTIAMAPRDATGLHTFATAVSSPRSPRYRRYLTVAQFARRFGATAPELSAVRRALGAPGIRVSPPAANHLTISVTGTAAALQRALSVSLREVRLRSGRVAYANTSAPMLPGTVARAVQGVVGLDDLHLPRSQAVSDSQPAQRPTTVMPGAASAGPTVTCPGATGTPSEHGGAGYSAEKIASAYRFSSLYAAGDLGAAQTIAVYELQPYDPLDIATYQACYGTAAPVTAVNVDGGPGGYGTGPNTDDSEAALDIELAVTTAPAANILVYQAPNDGSGALDAYSAIVSQDKASVVSSSWGVCEADARAGGSAELTSENTLFEEAAAQGQSVLIASGDSGSAACWQGAQSDASLSVGDPASQPFVTAVGGTSLYTGPYTSPSYYSPGQPAEESVWNDGQGSDGSANASTGGLSTQWAMPSYQSTAAASLRVINADSLVAGDSCGSEYCREVPDVSADADSATGYVVYTNGSHGGGWGVIGGTSAAAPEWAAFTALVNADPACRGLRIGFENPALYQIAGSAYPANFNDVTQPSPVTGSASNDALQANGNLFPVTPGYDMSTGLGSMNAPNLAASLCAARAPAFTVSVTSPGDQLTPRGQAVSLPTHASDTGNLALAYTATGLPAGLSINSATGLISGTVTTAQTTTVTVTARDALTNSSSASFRWTVVTPSPPRATGTVSGLGERRPKLTLTLTAAGNAPALRAVAISLPHGLSFKTRPSKGIALTSAHRKLSFSDTVRHGVLAITFGSPTRSAALTLAAPAITISAGEASTIRRQRVKQLVFRLTATNVSRKSSTITITLKKPS